MPQNSHFREWSTCERRLCAQRAAPERAETPEPTITVRRDNILSTTKDIVKSYKEFFEKHQKDLAVDPTRRGLEIGRPPIMARAQLREMGKYLTELHAACDKLQGAERTEAIKLFRDLLKDMEKEFADIGMRLLYSDNGPDMTFFRFDSIRFHYADHFEAIIAERRKNMPRLLPVPPELQDQEPGLRNNVVRQQTALRVERVREQVGTLEAARQYLMNDPETKLETQREVIADHFRARAQKPPEYAVDTTMPSLADVQEMGWALSALSAMEPERAYQQQTSMRNMFLAMGVIMTVTTSDWQPANALVGQRRQERANGPGFRPIWEKTGPNKWTCAVKPKEEKTDAGMAQMNCHILNPRYVIAFRKLSVRENVNEVEGEINQLKARREIAKQVQNDPPNTSALYEARAEEANCNIEIRGLTQFNDSLKLPDDKVLRHRAEQLGKLADDGFDEKEQPMLDLMADINTRFENLQKADKGTEARAVLDRVKDRLQTNGLAFDEYTVGDNATKSVRLMQAKTLPPAGPRRRALLRRRGDMQAFRDLTGSLRAYLAVQHKGTTDPDARKALDAAHNAGKEIEARFKALPDATEITLFESRLTRLLGEAGYLYTGFNRFGDLTYEYRSRY